MINTILLSIITLVMADMFDVQQKSPLSATADSITITAEKATGQTKPQMLTTGYLCVYANGKITITSTDTMYAITFGSCDMSQLAALTPSTGKMTQASQTDPIWNGAAKSVSFTISAKADYGKKTTSAGQLKFMTLSIELRGGGGGDSKDTTLVKGVDLYYGHYSGETPYKYFNHQLWLTSEGLTFDGYGIEGEDGHVMRLDLFCASATDLSGTYTITDPKDSDNPGCINKKYTYYDYFEGGSFVSQKLIQGNCTITCVTTTTYDIIYDFKEITTNKRHQGTLHNIPITAITSNDFSKEDYDIKPYTLVPICQEMGIEQTEDHSPASHIKRIENGQLIIVRDNVRYSITGQRL